MRKVSKKLARQNNSYSKLRKEFFKDKMLCQAAIHKCGLKATDVHHMKGRGKYHLDVSTWLAVCRNCHNWIEEHPIDAIELGYSLKRN